MSRPRRGLDYRPLAIHEHDCVSTVRVRARSAPRTRAGSVRRANGCSRGGQTPGAGGPARSAGWPGIRRVVRSKRSPARTRSPSHNRRQPRMAEPGASGRFRRLGVPGVRRDAPGSIRPERSGARTQIADIGQRSALNVPASVSRRSRRRRRTCTRAADEGHERPRIDAPGRRNARRPRRRGDEVADRVTNESAAPSGRDSVARPAPRASAIGPCRPDEHDRGVRVSRIVPGPPSRSGKAGARRR